MNTDNGRIYSIDWGRELEPNEVELTENEAKALKFLSAQERVDLYLKMNAAGRRQARRQKHRKGELP